MTSGTFESMIATMERYYAARPMLVCHPDDEALGREAADRHSLRMKVNDLCPSGRLFLLVEREHAAS